MWPAPYCESATHCASVEQPPHVLGNEIPHSWPVGQSADEPWQSPATQPPPKHAVDPPYDGSTLHSASPPHGWHVCVAVSQMCAPGQSDDTRHCPGMHRLLT